MTPEESIEIIETTKVLYKPKAVQDAFDMAVNAIREVQKYREIASIIHGVPTAFNKEKVIEELKQISKALFMAENFNGAACINKAIEIVEKGGKTEDFVKFSQVYEKLK